MKYDPEKHHRRSIRLKNYDYASSGTYFVTIVTHGRQCLFGQIVDGQMRLNECGEIVRDEWFASIKIRNEITLFENEFVIMPNHIHGIVWIGLTDVVAVNYVGANIVGMNVVGTNVGATGRSPLRNGPKNKSLSSFIAGYKSAVTKQINIIRKTPGTPVWQRNYYEHIIGNETELLRIRQYIANNPINWENDENYL